MYKFVYKNHMYKFVDATFSMKILIYVTVRKHGVRIGEKYVIRVSLQKQSCTV